MVLLAKKEKAGRGAVLKNQEYWRKEMKNCSLGERSGLEMLFKPWDWTR